MYKDIDMVKLHFKYCALIALMLFIGIATERWSASKDFTTYLSNAATMTSLFLGVVAILYSYVSNDSMSKSLGSISTITDEVRSVRSEVEDFVDIAKKTNKDAEKNSETFSFASESVSLSVTSLNTTLQSITQQNQELRFLIEALPGRMEQLETKFDGVAKAIGEKPQQPPASPADVSNKAVSRMLARASLNQNLLMHACVLAEKTKKPLSLNDFCDAINWNGTNHLQGFLGGMHAMQVCSRAIIDGQEKCYTIEEVHPHLKSNSKTYYDGYIGRAYKDKPEEFKRWSEKMKQVEALYSDGV